MKKTAIEILPTSVHHQAQRIPTVSITEATGPSRRTHPQTAIMLAMRAVQSETMSPAMRFSTGHSVSQPFLFLREHASIPMVCGGG